MTKKFTPTTWRVNDNPQEFPVGTRLAREGRTATVVETRVGNAHVGIWMATMRFDDDGSLLSLPYSNVRRNFTLE